MAQSKSLGFYSVDPSHHTVMEDGQGILTGALVSALGFYLLGRVGLLTGGTAGVAFLIHYAWKIPFGLLFFLVNLPFYYLSFRRLGLAFSAKTFLAIGLVSIGTEVEHRYLVIDYLHPFWGALMGGLLLGYGLLALYRHRASLGGIGILAIYIQERFGIQAGLIQLAFDSCVMLCAFLLLDPVVVAWSILGAVILNLFLAINHRSDRYIVVR
ncbi:YitT family protein [Rhizobium sp. SSA_523]|uniref:YitT family protein n=1 Tax=Rhizobium sp. SSA_523 TaxID=2952477 RepID=UPI0020902839|nr:YitT family protein [Rhizobium sp. SSA_523]MCO5732933.1 YitT family protein [Rhizobium sp. SSA_523]WKC23821.1 YitT family protein [Rhizobium sp. SSA_523]